MVRMRSVNAQNNNFNQPLIISLLLHLCLYLLSLIAPSSNLFPPENQPVEIVYQNETPKTRQIVMDPDEAKLEEALKKQVASLKLPVELKKNE